MVRRDVLSGVVGAPFLRAIEPAELRQRLFHELGRRFRSVGWGAIALLLITGTINVHLRGWLSWSVLGGAALWETAAGHALAIKLSAVTVMLILSAIHDFSHGPRAGQAVAGSPKRWRLRRRAALMTRVNALLGLLVVIAAARLSRG